MLEKEKFETKFLKRKKLDLVPRHSPSHIVFKAMDKPNRPRFESARYCSDCLKRYGIKVRQTRSSIMSGPMDLNKCMKFKPQNARISSTMAWWNSGPVRWLIAPLEPPSFNGWFVVIEEGTCSRCKRTVVEKVYRRQFGRIRLWIFKFMPWIEPNTKIVPVHNIGIE